MTDDESRDRLMAAWCRTPSADEVGRVRLAAAALRRLRRAETAMLSAWGAATMTALLASPGSRLESSARLVSAAAIVAYLVIAFLAARRVATSSPPPDAALGHVARGLRDERERELRWWVGGWSWSAWIAGSALVVGVVSWQARLSPGACAVLALIALGVLAVASWRYLRELRCRTDLARLDALVATLEGRAPFRPRTPRRSVRTAMRSLELGVACWAAVVAVRGPDPLAMNARRLMNAVHANAQWSQRLGLTSRGTAVPVAGDPIDRYCSVRSRLAPSLAAFAGMETHVGAALVIDLEEAAGVGKRHDVRWQEHAIAWEEARLTLITAADRALRSQGLRPDDLRDIGSQVETHEASTAFRLPLADARALVAARMRVQALEAILSDPAHSAIQPQATAALVPARETRDRLTARAGPPPATSGAPCGADPLAGIDWLAVLDAQPSPWNEALR